MSLHPRHNFRWFTAHSDEIFFFVTKGLKRSYFEVFIKLKKNGHTICDPYQIIKKIFTLRHHSVKSFWTKVGDFSPMPRLLRLTLSLIGNFLFGFFMWITRILWAKERKSKISNLLFSMSELLLSLFCKKRQEQVTHSCSLQKWN